MVFPLAPLAMVGGLATSAGANLYRAYAQHRMYDQFVKGYRALDLGYRSYLRKHGRTVNPNRALTSYYGNYLRGRTHKDLAMASGVGSVGGSLGAGTAMTWRMMK